MGPTQEHARWLNTVFLIHINFIVLQYWQPAQDNPVIQVHHISTEAGWRGVLRAELVVMLAGWAYWLRR